MRAAWRPMSTEIPRLRGFDRVHFLFEPALAKGEFRPQQIALGDGLLARERRQHLQPAHRQAHRPPPKGGQEHQHAKPGDQESEREIHRLFNQHAFVLACYGAFRPRRWNAVVATILLKQGH